MLYLEFYVCLFVYWSSMAASRGGYFHIYVVSEEAISGRLRTCPGSQSCAADLGVSAAMQVIILDPS